MKDNPVDTQTLEWLLEKFGLQNNGTMNDDDKIDLDSFEKYKEVNNNFISGSIIDVNNNLLKSSDFNPEQRKITAYNKKISEEINTVLRNLSDKKSRSNNTYYKNIYEYHGVVESIDKVNNKFSAVLVNVSDGDDMLSAEFNISDISYASDQELLDVGVKFIWIIGQESQFIFRKGSFMQGTQQNMSKFLIRRTQNLNNKKIKEAKDEANKWSELFRRYSSSDTTNSE